MPTYENIVIGDKATFTKTVTEFDIYQFAGITWDFNPVHVDAEYAKKPYSVNASPMVY